MPSIIYSSKIPRVNVSNQFLQSNMSNKEPAWVLLSPKNPGGAAVRCQSGWLPFGSCSPCSALGCNPHFNHLMLEKIRRFTCFSTSKKSKMLEVSRRNRTKPNAIGWLAKKKRLEFWNSQTWDWAITRDCLCLKDHGIIMALLRLIPEIGREFAWKSC